MVLENLGEGYAISLSSGIQINEDRIMIEESNRKKLGEGRKKGKYLKANACEYVYNIKRRMSKSLVTEKKMNS